MGAPARVSGSRPARGRARAGTGQRMPRASSPSGRRSTLACQSLARSKSPATAPGRTGRRPRLVTAGPLVGALPLPLAIVSGPDPLTVEYLNETAASSSELRVGAPLLEAVPELRRRSVAPGASAGVCRPPPSPRRGRAPALERAPRGAPAQPAVPVPVRAWAAAGMRGRVDRRRAGAPRARGAERAGPGARARDGRGDAPGRVDASRRAGERTAALGRRPRRAARRDGGRTSSTLARWMPVSLSTWRASWCLALRPRG